MTTAWNDVTGARLVSKANNKAYDANYDSIFKKPQVIVPEPVVQEDVVPSDDTGNE